MGQSPGDAAISGRTEIGGAAIAITAGRRRRLPARGVS